MLCPNQTVFLHPGRAWLPAPPATGPLRSSQTGLTRVSADLAVNYFGEVHPERTPQDRAGVGRSVKVGVYLSGQCIELYIWIWREEALLFIL